MPTKKKLSLKQETFCIVYVKNGGNATAAAIEAGYSRKTADRIASENLRKPGIIKKIEEIRKELGKDNKSRLLSVSEIVAELQKIALNPDDERTRDRLNALDMMLKVAGGYEKDNKQKGEGGQVTINISDDV